MKTFNIGGVPEHFNFPWHEAIREKAFEKEGIRLDWTDYPGGTGAMCQDLRSEKLDIAILLTEGAIADITKGNPSSIVRFYIDSPLVWGIHVSSGSNITAVNQIEGKRFAISRPGSGSHLMAYVDAKERGRNPDEHEMIVVQNLEGARAALKEGNADVFMWEKFTTKPYVDSGEFRLIGTCPTPWPCFVITVRNKVLKDHAREIKIVLDIIGSYNNRLMKDKNATKMISEKYQLLPEDVEEWFKITRWNIGHNPDKDVIKKVCETLYQLKIIEQMPDIKTLLYEFV